MNEQATDAAFWHKLSKMRAREKESCGDGKDLAQVEIQG